MKIFLIGFMGTGKTTVGQNLADLLKVEFYDLDVEIEKKLSLIISDIFHNFGIEQFRRIESEIFFSWQKEGIIATGGGIVEESRNRTILKRKDNTTIWLNPEWESIEKRIFNNDSRPLVNSLSKKKIFDLWKIRQALYRQCSDLEIQEERQEDIIRIIRKII